MLGKVAKLGDDGKKSRKRFFKMDGHAMSYYRNWFFDGGIEDILSGKQAPKQSVPLRYVVSVAQLETN